MADLEIYEIDSAYIEYLSAFEEHLFRNKRVTTPEEKNEITGIVKYTTYEKETKRSFRKKTFNTENWKYDAEQKEYTCPCGNLVPYKKTVTKKNKSGYLQTYEVYQCENCEGCPFRQLCTKSEYGRVIQRNGHWFKLSLVRQKAN